MNVPNVTAVPNIEQDKLRASVESVKRNIDILIEQQQLVAKVRFASFKAHIEAGFSPEQALQLCR
jgi:hypothetical protein